MSLELQRLYEDPGLFADKSLNSWNLTLGGDNLMSSVRVGLATITFDDDGCHCENEPLRVFFQRVLDSIPSYLPNKFNLAAATAAEKYHATILSLDPPQLPRPGKIH